MEVKCKNGFNELFGEGLNKVYYTIMGATMVIGLSTL